jgi:hypothetical protein
MSFEAGIRDAAHQALAALSHEDDDQMEHSQTDTSRAELVKELTLWCCLMEIVTTWDVCRTK